MFHLKAILGYLRCLSYKQYIRINGYVNIKILAKQANTIALHLY